MVAAPPVLAQDMMGPDLLKLLLALPKLILFAAGEFALFLAPLFALLALGSWLAFRSREHRGRCPTC